jgi:hypothetical protein
MVLQGVLAVGNKYNVYAPKGPQPEGYQGPVRACCNVMPNLSLWRDSSGDMHVSSSIAGADQCRNTRMVAVPFQWVSTQCDVHASPLTGVGPQSARTPPAPSAIPTPSSSDTPTPPTSTATRRIPTALPKKFPHGPGRWALVHNAMTQGVFQYEDEDHTQQHLPMLNWTGEARRLAWTALDKEKRRHLQNRFGEYCAAFVALATASDEERVALEKQKNKEFSAAASIVAMAYVDDNLKRDHKQCMAWLACVHLVRQGTK